MSILYSEPQIDDAIVIRVSAIVDNRVFVSVRVRDSKNWIYYRNIRMGASDEITIMDHQEEELNQSNVCIDKLPHNLIEELKERAAEET